MSISGQSAQAEDWSALPPEERPSLEPGLTSMREPIPIGPRIRRLRQRQALSQRDLAAKAGVNVETVTRIERTPPGIDLPRPSTIRKLAKALGVKPAELTAPEGDLTY